MAYYLGDLAPLKFMGVTVLLFAVLYFSRGFLSTVDTSLPIGESSRGKQVQASIIFEDLGRPRASLKEGSPGKRNVDMSGQGRQEHSQDRQEHSQDRTLADSSTSSGSSLSSSEKRDELWLALALRYLEAGRPSECIKYCNRLIDKKRRILQAKELKRLAQERYGVID